MKILSIQVALFPRNLIERPDLVYEKINKAENGMFDGMPNIFSLVDVVPYNYPVVTAHSKNNMYTMQIAKNRIDFFINQINYGDIEPYEFYKLHKDEITTYYKEVLKTTEIGRIGIIFLLFDENENSVKTIYEKYMKTSYSLGCSELSIRSNVQQQIKGFVLNNITIVENASLNIPKDKSSIIKKGIRIQIDTNNVQTKDINLTYENITSIISNAVSRIRLNSIKELI